MSEDKRIDGVSVVEGGRFWIGGGLAIAEREVLELHKGYPKPDMNLYDAETLSFDVKRQLTKPIWCSAWARISFDRQRVTAPDLRDFFRRTA